MLFARARRVSELEEELRKVKLDLRDVKLEWENTYDKLRHLMGRIAKRSAIMQSESTLPEGESAGGSADGLGPTSESPLTPILSRLTPSQQRVQMDIMRRRAGGR